MFNADNTLLSDYAKCPAMYLARHVFHRDSKAEKIAADVGNVYHSALIPHFEGAGKDVTMEVFEEELEKVVPDGKVPEEPRFERGNLRVIMEQFCDTRPPEAFPFEAVEMEKTVGLEIAEGITFYAKRDMLVKDKTSGLKVPLDHKTTRKISDWWSKKFRLASQLTGYMWLTSKLEGFPVEMHYVNAMELGKLPDSNRKCRTHKVPYTECRKHHCNFELLVYQRTQEQIDKWEQDFIILAKEAMATKEVFGGDISLLPHAPRKGAFNDGCTFCGFANWCRMGFRKEAMEELTVYRRWEPWAEQGETVTESVGDSYKWYFAQVANRIFPSKEFPGQGVVEMTEDDALDGIRKRGQETWMEIWQMYPFVQGGMIRYKERIEGGEI